MTSMQPVAAHSTRTDDHPAELAAFFAAAERASVRAAASSGEIVSSFRIAGRPVQFRFAGPALIGAMAPALAHLAHTGIDPAPELTVALWDSASTGVAMPAPPWPASAYSARGDILGFEDARYRVTYHVGNGVLSMIDMSQGRALCWIHDAQVVPSDVKSKPLLHILQWWLASHNCQPLHAGLVGITGGAALLAGQSGAGKSSTALACLAAGLLFGGDDFCMVETGDVLQAHSLYSSGRLHSGELESLPSLQATIVNPDQLDGEKALFFLQRDYAARMVASLPVRVLLLPRVCDQRDTTWEAAPAAAVREALNAGTLPLLPSASAPAALYAIRRLAARLPCCYLNLGNDRQQIPAAIATLLDGSS